MVGGQAAEFDQRHEQVEQVADQVPYDRRAVALQHSLPRQPQAGKNTDQQGIIHPAIGCTQRRGNDLQAPGDDPIEDVTEQRQRQSRHKPEAGGAIQRIQQKQTGNHQASSDQTGREKSKQTHQG